VVTTGLSLLVGYGLVALYDGFNEIERTHQEYKAKCHAIGGVFAGNFDGIVICVKELK
jgi:hypothetical protein